MIVTFTTSQHRSGNKVCLHYKQPLLLHLQNTELMVELPGAWGPVCFTLYIVLKVINSPSCWQLVCLGDWMGDVWIMKPEVLCCEPGPVFHLLSWRPVTWKPSHLAKSQVTLVADLEISRVALTPLFVFCIFLDSYMWLYGMFYYICTKGNQCCLDS